MPLRVLPLAFALLLAGCWGHSFPATERFIAAGDPALASHAEVFVDPNGTFYPTGFQHYLPRPNPWKHDSLLNETVGADKREFRELIVRDEARQLDDVEAFAQGKRRIFILVHGYNNTPQQAGPAFDAVEAKLDLGAGDGVLRFYWDGLTGTGVGGGKIWFNAVGNSQLAGARGLRRILSRIANKDIYLISHSRGASVILSALGNPVYDPAFLSQTRNIAAQWVTDGSDFLRPEPLRPAGNRIHVLMLAPAVDRIDFCDMSQQPEQRGRYACGRFRSLGETVSFRYSINPRDSVLRKFVGLQGGFNPTRLGQDAAVGDCLRQQHYPLMRGYAFPRAESWHGFADYAAHPVFTAMLGDAGILRPGVPRPEQDFAPPAAIC